jgi:hypothetical protein
MLSLTFVLQCINPFLIGAAALLCLRVRVPLNPHAQAAWRLTGIGFLWHAISSTLQNLFGGIALAEGNPSAAMDAYMAAAPAMNHSRTFLLYGLFAALFTLSFMRGEPGRRFWRGAWAALLAGFLAGAAMGWFEGPFTVVGHYSAVAVWDVVELVLLMAGLFALLVSNRADRLLWALLSTYGLGLALGIFWFMLLAQINPGNGTPASWTGHAERIFFNAVLVAWAAKRLVIQGRGKTVVGMTESQATPLPSLH